MAGADPYFFGYGSLVNCATHDYPHPAPARLKGWRRAWAQTELRKVAFLTAVPDPECEIEGLIARVPGSDWQALDEREWAYDRVDASKTVTHEAKDVAEIAVYAVPDERQSKSTERFPIWLSYIDVVVQGYLRVFGPDGADRFFETTSGWETPIYDDRAEPRYPRHQQLSEEEREFVDSRLKRIGVNWAQEPD